jgi:hypothetical protein
MPISSNISTLVEVLSGERLNPHINIEWCGGGGLDQHVVLAVDIVSTMMPPKPSVAVAVP